MFEPKARVVTSGGDIDWCYHIWNEVLSDFSVVKEDESERSHYFLGTVGMTTTSAARLVPKNNIVLMERIAVRKSFSVEEKIPEIVASMLAFARKKGFRFAETVVQVSDQDLFAGLHFQPTGKTLEGFDGPHIKMRLQL